MLEHCSFCRSKAVIIHQNIFNLLYVLPLLLRYILILAHFQPILQHEVLRLTIPPLPLQLPHQRLQQKPIIADHQFHEVQFEGSKLIHDVSIYHLFDHVVVGRWV